MENIRIDKITEADVTRLQQIAQETFLETFAHLNTEEDMNHYLNENLSISKLTAELQNEGSQFFFAMDADTIAGYLKVNTGRAQTELKDSGGLEVERIYVSKAYQGKKVGQLLFDRAMDMAKTMQAKYVWLGVWEDNHKAIRFYTKNGFEPFDKHIFKLGSDEQTDIMMKKTL
ncbi:GNAT family N-acetyltransferase [Mucilaginibacter pedocola]|uniref:GNAT family acetyltransferase n=1 Tax=Mucilaginibacter pedocola TaxID=1792845 RepID=A0A1S9PJR5_9SPHI|nr:GNAT family N-acetyltransferase [Mucilaginibacter pedocola]OOQ61196.1 GNAT family acetyltransferase [Mucilaginibacter pedocola]